MDFATFREKLYNDDLKSLTTPQSQLELLGQKYPEIEILGTYKLNPTHIGIHFKHKLWEKLAIFRGNDWMETRVMSLKNKLPEATEELLFNNLKKAISIIRLESVIPVGETFYYYVIAKISGQKFVLHISREGEVLLKSKFMEYSIRLDDEDEDDTDVDEEEDDDFEEVEELVVEEDLDLTD
jgi:hypothetical protein